MLTTSFKGRNPILCTNGRNSTIVFHGPTSKSQLLTWSNLKSSTSWSDPNFSLSRSDHNFNCLSQWQTTQLSAYIIQSQLPADSFHNLQILKTIVFEHDVIHTLASFPIWGLLWQLWLSYPLPTSVNCTQTV